MDFNPIKALPQLATIAHNAAYHVHALHVYVDFTMVDIMSAPFIIAAKATSDAVAANIEFYVTFEGSGTFGLCTSTGSALTFKSLSFPVGYVKNGMRFRLSLTHHITTGDFQLWDWVENPPGIFTPTLIETEASAATASIQTLAQPLAFGALSNGSIPGTYKAPAILLHEFRIASSRTGSPTVFSLFATPMIDFNGPSDLGYLPSPAVTSLVITSGQTLTLTGPLLNYKNNTLSVPEIYHEDIVRYCLGRAHNKNQNYRASEEEMKSFEQKVANRRSEAETTDGPDYKIGDPEDYEPYGIYN